MPKTVIVAIYDAVGGPATTSLDASGIAQGPTDAGTYVVARCGKHVSSKLYRHFSGVPWGTPLRAEKDELQVQVKGRWQKLSDFTPVTRKELEDYHEEWYGSRTLPSTWVFNDFGHATCYVFKDVNRNGLLDKGTEKIHGEFIHTTPPDEANTKRGLPVVLTESHGCVHVKPADIDGMTAKGYLARGNRVVYHAYSDKPPAGSVAKGKAPYAVHFYPGARKILVFGTAD